jgi:predicted TPR repeat methyltransferase
VTHSPLPQTRPLTVAEAGKARVELGCGAKAIIDRLRDRRHKIQGLDASAEPPRQLVGPSARDDLGEASQKSSTLTESSPSILRETAQISTG